MIWVSYVLITSQMGHIYSENKEIYVFILYKTIIGQILGAFLREKISCDLHGQILVMYILSVSRGLILSCINGHDVVAYFMEIITMEIITRHINCTKLPILMQYIPGVPKKVLQFDS
jgi:hypothetical protein